MRMKKKVKVIIGIIIVVVLVIAIGKISSHRVNTLTNWSFQYNDSTDDYSLFFALCDTKEREVAASGKVSIRIENENGQVVYEGKKAFDKSDFGTYDSKAAGEHFLADVRIGTDEMAEGSSENGTVYFTVSGSDYVFDEVRCEAYNLPTKEITIDVQELPQEICQKDWDGSVKEKLMITDVTYSTSSDMMAGITFSISGEKTFGSRTSLGYDMIDYQLCDGNGYVVDSGQIFIDKALGTGDKFTDDSLTIYDLIPGETYVLTFQDGAW